MSQTTTAAQATAELMATWNMTDDRTLLERAAKAAGIEGQYKETEGVFAYARHRPDIPHSYEPSQWDPAAAYRRAIVRAAAALSESP